MYGDLSPLILLDNGLKLMLQHRPDHPGVYIRANVRMGSFDERLSRDKGICNLIERLCWRGNEKMSAKMVIDSSSIGGRLTGGGVGRAFTTYHTWCPTNEIGHALGLLDNVIFRPRMDADDLELEKRLAIMRIGAEDCDPVSHATQIALTNLYPKHRVAFGMLGTPETVNNMKVTRMRELVRGAHRPQTIVLGLSGNLPPFDQLETLLGNYAGGFVEKTRAANAIPLGREWGDSTPAHSSEETETWGYRDDWTTIIIFPVPSNLLNEDGRVMLSIACKLLGDGPTSVLRQKLMASLRTPLAYDIQADFEWLDDIAWIRIVIRSGGSRGADIAQAANNILTDVLGGRIKDDEMAAARAAVRADMMTMSADPEAKLALDMGWLSTDTNAWTPDMDIPWIDDIESDDIREFLRLLFGINPRSVCNIAR